MKHKAGSELLFSLDLIIDVIDLCQCVLSAKRLEFAPRCIPIDIIPALSSARRKVYMTATLANDGILVTHVKARPEAISKPIKPKGAGDMGDRMIITPQDLNQEIKFAELKEFCANISKSRNVVTIVPSKPQADQWRDVARLVLDKDNINEGVGRLKSGYVRLVVLLNKYDGIDLPGKACELLVLDGLPSY